jgi:hypothetical protein
LNKFSTKEFYLACWLHSKGLRLIEIKKIDGNNRCEFVFEDSKEREKLVKEYWDNTGLISPKTLISSIKELKNRLYAEVY